MDSPRGRIYQMVQVAAGAPATPSYVEHIELCLACRACETACPSGVRYGALVEAARAGIENAAPRPWTTRLLRRFVFGHLLQSPVLLRAAGALMFLWEVSGLQRLARGSGFLKLFGRLGRIESLAPPAELPFFFGEIGKTFPADGERRHRVALMAGCIANVSFARLNEATVRVLQRNGCEVTVPAEQTCCGALHVHSGLRDDARALARRNIDAVLGGGFDAILTNAAGCGSTLKEYDELLEHDPRYHERAKLFVTRMKDVNEYLASIDLNREMAALNATVTYQDSCHLAHGQKIRAQPRKLLAAVPGLTLKEMPFADICCGSAGIYNVVQDEMAAAILETKMSNVNLTGAEIIATANPGCMLQLRAGAKKHGSGQRVVHVIEILDEAYRKYDDAT
jgi:glycolate oxidase iron-sulfur subunit